MGSFLVISILISKQVLEQYGTKATSFKQSEVEITEKESVTIALGFWPLKKMDYPEGIPAQSYDQLELGKDFSLSFGVTQWLSSSGCVLIKEGVLILRRVSYLVSLLI